MDASHPSANFAETLTRLSNKPGVRAALVLDRSLKTVLQSTGSFAWLRIDTSAGSNGVASHALQDDGNQQTQGAEQVASMVWNYVNATEALIQGLDSEDSAKLLRLRTRKHELVIVPDAKYIFVVVHETSPS